jgi:hypothetical protein
VLHTAGVDASFFDAIAVLIAVVALAQLLVGPSVGAAAACSSSAVTGGRCSGGRGAD